MIWILASLHLAAAWAHIRVAMLLLGPPPVMVSGQRDTPDPDETAEPADRYVRHVSRP